MTVAWARSQAERLLAPLGVRWLHVQVVANKAHRLATVLSGDDGEALVAAAFLHDIGYAPPLNRLGFHPVDGAYYLRSHGQERLARLVAYHSGARFEAEERGLLEELAAFPVEDGPVMDALTFVDMTTGPARTKLAQAWQRWSQLNRRVRLVPVTTCIVGKRPEGSRRPVGLMVRGRPPG